MPAPYKFSRKLHEVIGNEAAEAMVDWMNQTDDKLDALRHELSEFRQTMRADFAELRQEMNAKFAVMESAAERRHADFMKWTMGFWALSLVTYVGAVVALAKVLR